MGRCERVKAIFFSGMLLCLAACDTIWPATKSGTGSGQPSTSSAKSINTQQTQVAVLDPDNDADALSRHRRALIAATNDALDSNEIGYYIDILEARLIQQVRDSSVSIIRNGTTFTLLIAGSAAFDNNGSRLKHGIRNSMASITGVLEEYRNIQISIFGHTDNTGDGGYNQRLSVRRAQSVARFMIDGGVAAKRIAIIGYGEERPSVPNETAEGRRRNRRIEILLTPLAR